MRQAVLGVTVVALLLVFALAGTPAVGAAQETTTDTETVIQIQLQENGDARWSVITEFNLTDENETAAFERLRAEFESGSGSGARSVAVFREAADRVSQQTDREMEITDVERTSDIEAGNGSQTGRLTLSFTWTNFASTVDNRAIAVDDAFRGGWFGNLGPSQTLEVRPPPGYQVHTARPSTDIVGGALRWEGPETFQPGEPSIQFRPLTTQTSPPPTQQPQGIPWTFAAVGFGAVVLFGLVLLAWQGGYLGGGASGGGDDGPPPDDRGGAEAGDVSTADAGTESSPMDGAESEVAAGSTMAGTEATIDTDLLSDEERVEHLLRQHGGRMKQARIVEETRWSNAKVSQLLSSMAEEGRVDKLRIGRENLISLPEYEDDREF